MFKKGMKGCGEWEVHVNILNAIRMNGFVKNV